MHRQKAILQRYGIFWVLFIAAAVSGCRTCNDIAPGAIPQPNGTYACQWAHEERGRAAQDNFVIYQYEWSADVTKLTPFGQRHVAQIAQSLCQAPFSVVIEPSSDRRLDEARRMAVLEVLANSGNPIPPDRVILARPEAEGLYGLEAAGTARGMFGAQTGGQSAGAGTLGAGATAAGIQGGMVGGAAVSGGAGGGIGIY
jgi:hypothetical protein